MRIADRVFMLFIFGWILFILIALPSLFVTQEAMLDLIEGVRQC